ncbi:hypothetical protein SAMN06265784_103450 [Paraburkholderia susongensis]|uniref:Uncharacterized protein n=1 Tax=Paraburkholderia susongensis TaxID=1515439 RepID=A0A1X7K7P2_9BURK|nr:hypothetical protein SAMN06265784_103450 [Paraburkholderia susongensis]
MCVDARTTAILNLLLAVYQRFGRFWVGRAVFPLTEETWIGLYNLFSQKHSANFDCWLYLPIQNLLKITPSRSSELNSPVIEFN